MSIGTLFFATSREGVSMKILAATVDKRPCECSACPICSQVRSRAPCGVVKIVTKGHAVQAIKVPDCRCLLKERVR